MLQGWIRSRLVAVLTRCVRCWAGLTWRECSKNEACSSPRWLGGPLERAIYRSRVDQNAHRAGSLSGIAAGVPASMVALF